MRANEEQNVKPSPQTIVVPTGHLNVTPLGFHFYATQYLSVARLARIDSEFSPVPYYLYCKALELSLKAHLLAQGVAVSELKNQRLLGHDLIQILGRAEALNLSKLIQVADEERNELTKANAYYVDKEFEYAFEHAAHIVKAMTGYPALPDMAVLDGLADRLLDALQPVCLAACEGIPPELE